MCYCLRFLLSCRVRQCYCVQLLLSCRVRQCYCLQLLLSCRVRQCYCLQLLLSCRVRQCYCVQLLLSCRVRQWYFIVVVHNRVHLFTANIKSLFLITPTLWYWVSLEIYPPFYQNNKLQSFRIFLEVSLRCEQWKHPHIH